LAVPGQSVSAARSPYPGSADQVSVQRPESDEKRNEVPKEVKCRVLPGDLEDLRVVNGGVMVLFNSFLSEACDLPVDADGYLIVIPQPAVDRVIKKVSKVDPSDIQFFARYRRKKPVAYVFFPRQQVNLSQLSSVWIQYAATVFLIYDVDLRMQSIEEHLEFVSAADELIEQDLKNKQSATGMML
jgi:hypothetical protein